MNQLHQLGTEWMLAKATEKKSTETRRKLEDKLLSLLGIADNQDSVETTKVDGLQIKVTGRLNRKVDGDKLQAIAVEAGLSNHLSTLFRWKPEINKSAWKNADEEITSPLLGAITTTPGRPSFQITSIEEK